MTYQPLRKKDVVDFAKLEQTEDLSAFIAYLEAITAPAHDASEHKFNDPEGRGVCTTCGWVHPDVVADCCNESMRDHILDLLKLARDIHDGVEPQHIAIEVTIIEVTPRRRRGLFG